MIPVQLDVRTHPDGIAIRDRADGTVIEIFPTLEGAIHGRRAAREALAMLAATLAQPRRPEVA